VEFRIVNGEEPRAWFSRELLLPHIEAMARESAMLAGEIRAAVKRGEEKRRERLRDSNAPGRPTKDDDPVARTLTRADQFMVGALCEKKPNEEQQTIRDRLGVSGRLTMSDALAVVAKFDGVHVSTLKRSIARVAKPKKRAEN
jgi:hypothetical protein